MNWHTGNIAEAVAESKAKDAIFVVYIEGEDEMSAKLDKFLCDSRVNSKLMTSDFVAVKIQGDSPTYAQFIALYKVVPVPSIFFIGNSGTPLDVTTGIIASVEELMVKIDKVLLLAGKKQANQEASTSSHRAEIPAAEVERSIAGAEKKLEAQQAQQAEQEEHTEQAVAEESASEDGSSEAAVPEPIETPQLSSEPVKQTTPPVTAPEPTAASLTAAAAAEKRAASAAATAATSSMLPTAVASLMPVSVPLVATQASTTQEPVVDIQQRVEQRRAERQEEQRRRDKDNELRRRREGRESQLHQAQAREQELKNMQERLRRERQEEQATRDRIRAQIAADRQEQANRVEAQSNNTLSTTTTAMSSPAESTVSNSSSAEETRLQIRLPGGITRTKAFHIQEPLATVRVYVTNELLAGSSNIRNFSLATSYPRREFQTEDELKSLVELNLVPNAVLLVLQREQVNGVVRTSNNLFSIMSSVIWAILTPVTMAFDYLNKMGLQRIRQRFVQMVSNVGFKATGRPIAENDNEIAAAQDASARRNMGLFTSRRERPTAADTTSDDATSTHSSDPQYQPPNMFFSQGASSQHTNPQQRVGGGSSSSTSNSKSGGSFKRYGASNIRRLADTKDDEDEKATYNGNSTQQQ